MLVIYPWTGPASVPPTTDAADSTTAGVTARTEPTTDVASCGVGRKAVSGAAAAAAAAVAAAAATVIGGVGVVSGAGAAAVAAVAVVGSGAGGIVAVADDLNNRAVGLDRTHGRLLGPVAALFGRHRSSAARLMAAVSASCCPHGAIVDFERLSGWLSSAERTDCRAGMRARMEAAHSYPEWASAAAVLDEIEGHNRWKNEPVSSYYDHGLMEARLALLADAQAAGDIGELVFLVRTSLARDLANMGDHRLYTHAYVGTKTLIERYIDQVRSAIKLVTTSADEGVPGLRARTLLDQVAAAAQAFGRSALLLSGGGTLGMCHIGVVKALWEEGVLPRIISGTSAGSIVAAVLCAKTDSEIPEAISTFTAGDLDVFVQAGSTDGTVLAVASRLLKHGVVFDVGNLVRVMQSILGNLTFQEAYNRTRRILNITVSTEGVYELPRLLNYVTAPDVLIWSAVAASCAVPLVFASASLLAKDSRTGRVHPWHPSEHRWIDGSVENDLPIARLAELFNVNHFIVSQVNPHVAPFLANGPFPKMFNSLAGIAKTEVAHRLQMLAEMGVWPSGFVKARAILNQRYCGDITILPAIPPTALASVLRNPTPEFMKKATLVGEQATWPKLSQIQNHCAIEIALEEAVQKLRAQAAFTPSQVTHRANTLRLAALRQRFPTLSSGRSRSRCLTEVLPLSTVLKQSLEFFPGWPTGRRGRDGRRTDGRDGRRTDGGDGRRRRRRLGPTQGPSMADIWARLFVGWQTTAQTEDDFGMTGPDGPVRLYSPYSTTHLPELHREEPNVIRRAASTVDVGVDCRLTDLVAIGGPGADSRVVDYYYSPGFPGRYDGHGESEGEGEGEESDGSDGLVLHVDVGS